MRRLNELCELDAPSGHEGCVRDFIIRHLPEDCTFSTDALGNLIVKKSGQRPAVAHVMVDAHMDEVGVICTAVDEDGFLFFDTVGGICTEALLGKRVRFGSVKGVIGCRPIHLVKGEARKQLPERDSLTIDIGAVSRDEALSRVEPGDCGVFDEAFVQTQDGLLISKALDDRIGCAVLLELLQQPAPYGYTAVFSTQEEVGCRGAKVATYRVDPDYAICLEGTTAADIAGIPADKQVCRVGKGPVISFMDHGTLYDRDMVELALNSGVVCQKKEMVAGGNNAGAVHLSRGGVKTVAISAACRYIHSGSSVVSAADGEAMLELTRRLVERLAGQGL